MSCPVSPLIRIEDPQSCRVIERINRFVVLIEIKGKTHRAHINNTGRLSEFLVKGRRAYCIKNQKVNKTDYRLFAIEEAALGALVDTQLQMRAFEKSLEESLVPWIKRCRIVRRNARLGTSLIDYLLECQGNPVYLEVKSAVLRDGSFAMYPDCLSLRGQKHIREISDHVRKGGQGKLVFMAALPQVKAFKPNKQADPRLYEWLVKAAHVGIEVRSIGLYYNPQDSCISLFNPDLPVDLS